MLTHIHDRNLVFLFTDLLHGCLCPPLSRGWHSVLAVEGTSSLQTHFPSTSALRSSIGRALCSAPRTPEVVSFHASTPSAFCAGGVQLSHQHPIIPPVHILPMQSCFHDHRLH